MITAFCSNGVIEPLLFSQYTFSTTMKYQVKDLTPGSRQGGLNQHASDGVTRPGLIVAFEYKL